jgi:Cu(I)/Ag(I) efflux system membrane fusion protein/cobalt-zinc-cadmium efflux system membrane fusion protein
MNKKYRSLRLFLAVMSALGAMVAGFGIHLQLPTAAQASETYYTCPMHPTIVKGKPGACPLCGMDLVPVHEEEKEPGPSAGVIKVDPVMVQNMGVRVVDVKRREITRNVRTIGEVEVAEDQLSVINLRFSGWIEKIYADETGQEIKRGQALFSIYSPELVSTQKEYLLAYNTSGKDSELTKAAADRILLWNIPRSVLDRVVAEQNVDRNLIIRAPRSGYILHKNVVQGARINAGSDLYQIGSLKKIWVNAEVYAFDAPWIQKGQQATMELSFQQGRAFPGTVNYIYPTLNKKSRTLNVRLEFSNPGISLKPGMFATVRIEAQRKENVLVIPTEAIIHSGERQIVFITKRVGRYESREIVTGLVGDKRETEVLSGLEEGDTVVTSGQFLLDSESQLQEAVQKLLEARLQSKKTGHKTSGAEHSHDEKDHGDSYWTCGMHPNIVQEGPGGCPICGMDLVEKKR